MKNKLGISSLVISLALWVIFYFSYFYDYLHYFLKNIIGIESAYDRGRYVLVFIFLLLFLIIVDIIIGIRTLFIREEFKGYPILAILIILPLLLFLLFSLTIFGA